MSLPEQQRRIAPHRAASAAYNFIPLPERVVTAVADAGDLPSHDTYANPGYPHTGYFDVTLTTLSPLYIRGGLSTLAKVQGTNKSEWVQAEAEKADASLQAEFRKQMKNKPEFFHTQSVDQPVIPGSSLRGMLRSLLEIISYGKLTHERMDDKRLMYRAVGDISTLGTHYREQLLGPNQVEYPEMKFEYPLPRLKGGYLCRHHGGWGIRPALADATRHGESFVHVEYTQAKAVGINSGRQGYRNVFIHPGPRRLTARSRETLVLNLAMASGIESTNNPMPAGMVPAVLVTSGHLGSKHMHCAIYEQDPKAAVIPISAELWQTYEKDRDLTRGSGTPTRKLNKNGQPLFYLEDAKGNLIFFGPTMMFRLPYKQSVFDLIPAHLRQPLDIDYSDALFGFVRRTHDFPKNTTPPRQGDRKRSYAGRVAVTDAALIGNPTPEQLWLTGSVKKVLVPKILASAKPTSFQHYLVQTSNIRQQLNHYDSHQGRVIIRGWKRYWFQGNPTAITLKPMPGSAELDDQGEVRAISTQHTQMCPVSSGNSFRFRVYFENISDEELGSLCWVLHPFGDADKKYCHSLGMGKPLGMGVVSLVATLQICNRSQRYKSFFQDSEWRQGYEQTSQHLADTGTLHTLTAPFESAMLRELFKHDLPPGTEHLRELKRIGILLKMLEWEEVPPNGRANSLSILEFKERWVLPSPEHYASQLTGSLVPPIFSRLEHDESHDNDSKTTVESVGLHTTKSDEKPYDEEASNKILEKIVATRQAEQKGTAGSGEEKPLKVGDTVQLLVISREGIGGVVKLPSQHELKVDNLGRWQVGEIGKFKVVRFAGNGLIKQLKAV